MRVLLLGVVVVLAPLEPLAAQETPEPAKIEQALYRGDFERALSLASSYAGAHPKLASASVLLARAEIAKGDIQTGFSRLQKALRLDPGNVDALYYLAKLSQVLSQIEYKQLFSMAPDSARVHQLLGESYEAQHDSANAEREYQAALKANPNLTQVVVALGDLKRMRSQYEEAAQEYLKALKLDPSNFESTFGLGACYLRLGQTERAVQYFERALALDPDSALGRVALGNAFIHLGQYGKAVPELTAAIRIEPRMRQAYMLLGRSYQKLGRDEEAKAAFDKARELAQSGILVRQESFEADELIPAAPAKPRN